MIDISSTKDLKPGMVIEVENHDLYIVFPVEKTACITEVAFANAKSNEYTLSFERIKERHIIKIYDKAAKCFLNSGKVLYDAAKTSYNRAEVKEILIRYNYYLESWEEGSPESCVDWFNKRF